MLAQHTSSSAPLEDIELEADPESVNVNPEAQQSSSSAPLEDKELDADPEAVNPDVQQDTSSTQLEDRELKADQKAVNMNPDAQKAFMSTHLQDRGMDAETKRSVVEVSILQQERAKKHKVTISTRSKSKKSTKAKNSMKYDRKMGQISD